MSPDQRREAVVRAALPLLIEHGPALTTRQVAQAAGIAEGTVFRAFTDKDELVRTCVTEAFRTDELREHLAATADEPDLPERFVRIGVLIDEHLARVGELMRTLATHGYDVHQHGDGSADRKPGDPPQFIAEITEATAPLLEAEQLRRPPEEVVRTFLGVLMSTRFEPDADSGDRRERVRRKVDLLLRGALPD